MMENKLPISVPRSTLKDRISGRVIHGTNPGPRPYLSSVVAFSTLSLLLRGGVKGIPLCCTVMTASPLTSASRVL